MPFDNVKRIGMLRRRKEELDEAMKATPGGDSREPRKAPREPEPGSEEYLRRRQREAEQDLRDAPRRGR